MLRNRDFSEKRRWGRTLEKSSKSDEISTSRGRFAKTDDFQLRNASDNVKGTIRTGSRKIDDFERKMLRIAENSGKPMPFFANRLLQRVRTCFEITIFPKNVDGDPRKIVKKPRNFDV